MKNGKIGMIFVGFLLLFILIEVGITHPVFQTMKCDSNYYCTINHNYLLFNHKSHIKLSPYSVLEKSYLFANHVLTVESDNEWKIVFFNAHVFSKDKYIHAFDNYMNNPSDGLELKRDNPLSVFLLLVIYGSMIPLIYISVKAIHYSYELKKSKREFVEMLLHSNNPEAAIEKLVESRTRRFNRKKR